MRTCNAAAGPGEALHKRRHVVQVVLCEQGRRQVRAHLHSHPRARLLSLPNCPCSLCLHARGPGERRSDQHFRRINLRHARLCRIAVWGLADKWLAVPVRARQPKVVVARQGVDAGPVRGRHAPAIAFSRRVCGGRLQGVL